MVRTWEPANADPGVFPHESGVHTPQDELPVNLLLQDWPVMKGQGKEGYSKPCPQWHA